MGYTSNGKLSEDEFTSSAVVVMLSSGRTYTEVTTSTSRSTRRFSKLATGDDSGSYTTSPLGAGDLDTGGSALDDGVEGGGLGLLVTGGTGAALLEGDGGGGMGLFDRDGAGAALFEGDGGGGMGLLDKDGTGAALFEGGGTGVNDEVAD